MNTPINQAVKAVKAGWVASLEGLSEEPLRRAAQIALAAIDVATCGWYPPPIADAALEVASDALQSALSEGEA